MRATIVYKNGEFMSYRAWLRLTELNDNVDHWIVWRVSCCYRSFRDACAEAYTMY